MALLSMDMIREIQGVAEHYAMRERERLARSTAARTTGKKPGGTASKTADAVAKG